MQTKQLTTCAEFKRAIKTGVKIHTLYHMEFSHRNPETLEVVYKTIDRGIREVSKVQTKRFSLKTEKKNEPGKFSDSWMNFPIAATTIIKDGQFTFQEEDRDGKLIPILTYSIIED